MAIGSLQDVNTLFERFKKLNILIIGDVMIDSYLWGRVERISPEAPVPIVAVNKRASRLGGAANVALNVKALGARPLLCSVIGNDDKADTFQRLLKENNMYEGGIYRSDNRITTTKFRVIGNNAQMLRVDEEMEHPLIDSDRQAFEKLLTSIFEQEQIDAVIFQDYDKGVITPALITAVRDMAAQKNIPVAIDPKRRNFDQYRHLTLFKPNLKELRDGLGIDFLKNDLDMLRKAVRTLHEKQQLEIILSTLSDEGVFISRKNNDGTYTDLHIPAHLRSIADVSGAGDTVVSMATLCLALGLPDYDIAALSNLAGGQVCESVGVVPVDRDKLNREIVGLGL
ncbi:MAG: bifunctional heptose 7-phosphate kinase/heptose 1-phosphate adenyltransferase [Bacteroidota bacterium]